MRSGQADEKKRKEQLGINSEIGGANITAATDFFGVVRHSGLKLDSPYMLNLLDSWGDRPNAVLTAQ